MYVLPPLDTNPSSVLQRNIDLLASEQAYRAAAGQIQPSSPGLWANGHAAGFNPYMVAGASFPATAPAGSNTVTIPGVIQYTGPTTVTGDPNFGTLDQPRLGSLLDSQTSGLSLIDQMARINGGYPPPPGLGNQSLPLPLAPSDPFPLPPPPLGHQSLPLPVAPTTPWPVLGGSGQSSPGDPILGSTGSYVPPSAPTFTVSAVQSVADTAGAAPAGSGAVDTGLLGALLGAIGPAPGSTSDPGSGVATSMPTSLPSSYSQPVPPAAPASASPAGISPAIIIGIVLLGLLGFWYFAIRKHTNPHAIGPPA